MNRITELKFTNFRGASQPVTFQFDAKQPIVLIFGENGTGKSTIADALDFLCNNEFGSLQQRSGTRPGTHIVSTQGQAKNLAVEMVYNNTTWKATLQGGKPRTAPTQPPRAFILRRADITRIMEATDSKRYETLQAYITVPLIEKTEAELRRAYKTAAAELNDAIGDKQQAETTLERFWIAEGRPLGDCLTWANESVRQTHTHLQQQLNTDTALLDQMEQLLQAEETLAQAESQLEQALNQLAQVNEQLAQASQSEANADLVATLQAAQTYLHNHLAAASCPVCGKPEPRTALLSQIQNQLDTLSLLQQLRQQQAQAQKRADYATGAAAASQQNWHTAYSTLHPLLPHSPDPATGLATLRQTLLPRLNQEHPALKQRIAAAQKTLNQRNAISTQLRALVDLDDTLIYQNTLTNRLRDMLAIIENERKQYVETVVKSISSTVAQLYERIHPHEPLGQPNFSLKKKTIGSLELTGQFGPAHNVPPGAYYSEAHLDTLGLCVYLALAKHAAAGHALIVLDDILTSIDDPHLDRIIDLINDESAQFGQVIITTHSRAWFDRIRMGHGMKAQLIELYGWHLHHGMHHSHAPLMHEELRHLLQQPRLDRQAVASKAGVALEKLLDALAVRFACPLPRKIRPEYTLGELSGAFNNKLLKHLRVERLDATGQIISQEPIQPLFAQATQDGWIRNQVGAHFNANASSIPDTLVKQFGQHVLALADALLCPHCHQIPRSKKSGSYWECGGGCGKTRLYPLQVPD
ncbi:MAG: AAA family ATPase [Chloroflexi bacterium]|nr:AAA family ATPase [Chloroflexota bacterium]